MMSHEPWKRGTSWWFSTPVKYMSKWESSPIFGGENKTYLSCHHPGNDDADGRRQEVVFLCSSTSGNHVHHFTRFEFPLPIATLSHSSIHNATTRH